jgi:myosin heavy subunit
MNETTITRDPAVLALEIRTLQQQAESILTSYIIEIGRRLCEAKAVLDHGQWGQWLKDQVKFSKSTANNYMKIYERFGADQASLFGDSKFQAVGNLPYTKALKLLALTDDEVEDFVTENNVEDMSTRELAKAIKERDEAKKALEEEKTHAESLATKADELRKAAEDAQTDLETAEAEADAAKQEADSLRAELDALKAKPVEVAVMEPSPELLEQIRAEESQKAAAATADLEKKLAEAEAKVAKEAEKVKKLKDKVGKAGEEAKAAMQKDVDAATAAQKEAEAAKAEAEARAKALEEKLKTANSDAATFNVYFQSTQENCNRMLGLIRKADAAQTAKYKAALRALLDSVGGML